jgi:hypothetical protein
MISTLLYYSSIWIALTAQLIAVPIAIRAYLRNKSRALGYFVVYIILEALSSSGGIVIGFMGIHNTTFYLYSTFVSSFFFMLFAYEFIRERSYENIVLLLYSAPLIYTALVIMHPDKHEHLSQFQIFMLFEVAASALILHSQLKNPNGLRFHEDPWSIIAFILVSTLSISLVSLEAASIIVVNKFSVTFVDCMSILNAGSVFLQHTLVSRQLLKLSPMKIAE